MKVYLKQNKEIDVINEIKSFHQWIYSSNIERFEGNLEDALVDVYSSNNEFIARGYINFNSKILVRVLTLDINEEINYDFFYNRILDAYKLRYEVKKEDLLSDFGALRLVFSEADYLPGLVVDKYGKYLVIQSTTKGIDYFLPIIQKVLEDIYKPNGIILRNDVNVRSKEGLELETKYLTNPFDPLIDIVENGVKMTVDVLNGQKTGYFLDQKDNRLWVKNHSLGKDVLDLFCHTGGFGLHAALGNAKSVTCVDVSKLALDRLSENARLNGFENINYVEEDILEYLPILNNENKKFDMIILDPPAFTKTKDTINQAYKGYLKINRYALNLVKKGGYLLTFSCSRYMDKELFKQMLTEACLKENKKVQVIEERFQANDHPNLLETDNSLYLKCFILRILN